MTAQRVISDIKAGKVVGRTVLTPAPVDAGSARV